MLLMLRISLKYQQRDLLGQIGEQNYLRRADQGRRVLEADAGWSGFEVTAPSPSTITSTSTF